MFISSVVQHWSRFQHTFKNTALWLFFFGFWLACSSRCFTEVGFQFIGALPFWFFKFDQSSSPQHRTTRSGCLTRPSKITTRPTIHRKRLHPPSSNRMGRDTFVASSIHASAKMSVFMDLNISCTTDSKKLQSVIEKAAHRKTHFHSYQYHTLSDLQDLDMYLDLNMSSTNLSYFEKCRKNANNHIKTFPYF